MQKNEKKLYNMNIRKIAIIMLFAVLIGACKNKDSKDNERESDAIEIDEGVGTLENDNEINDAALVVKVKNYITTKYLLKADLKVIPKDQRKFQFVKIDINNDGEDEVLVNFMTNYFCGTGGCNLLLLNTDMEPITNFTVTKTPLYIAKSEENTWGEIWTHSAGKWRKLVYKDDSYPTNPSLVTAAEDAPPENAVVLFKKNSELETYSF